MNARLILLMGAVALAACEQSGPPDPDSTVVDAAPEGGDGAAPPTDSGNDSHDATHEGAPDTMPDEWDGSGCPGMTRPRLSECTRAAVVAHCGGEGLPRLFCRAVDELASPECLWFEGGCPAREFSRRCDAPSLPDCYPGRFGGFGTAPWTLGRATTIDIAVDPMLAAAPEVTVACDPCRVAPGAMAPDGWQDGRCLRREGLCGEALEPLQRVNLSAAWPWPSWVSRMIVHPSLGGGATLLIEFDPQAEAGLARACIVWQSDASITEAAPVCATQGELTIDHWPVSREQAASVRGRLVAEFPPLSPYPDIEPFVEGLRIEARF